MKINTIKEHLSKIANFLQSISKEDLSKPLHFPKETELTGLPEIYSYNENIAFYFSASHLNILSNGGLEKRLKINFDPTQI